MAGRGGTPTPSIEGPLNAFLLLLALAGLALLLSYVNAVIASLPDPIPGV